MSSTLTGALLSKGVLSRATELEKSRVLIAGIKLRIQYAAHGIGVILDSYIEENRASLPVYLKLYKSKTESGLSPQEALCKCLDLNETKTSMQEGDRSCLKSFFTSLGGGDVESETALCELYEELIAERLDAARGYAEKYSGMYTILGALAGVTVVILLI